jgi:histidinol-phosphatase (PHP family)
MEIQNTDPFFNQNASNFENFSSRTAFMDYHVHEKHSRDAPTADIESYVKRAEQLGIQEIAFTTHLIVSGPNQSTSIRLKEIPEYIDEILNAQENTKVKLRVGFEVDYSPSEERTLEFLLDEYNLDFVLGSVHYVDRWNIACKEKSKQFFQDRPIYEALKHYYQTWKSAAESGLFDVMSHPDYYRKNMHHYEKTISWEDYNSILYESVDSLVSYNIGFEVNTSGYRHGLEDNFPTLDFLKAAKKTGVQCVTIGSDSHWTETLGFGLYNALNELKNIGFMNISIFRKRKNNKIRIDNIIEMNS